MTADDAVEFTMWLPSYTAKQQAQFVNILARRINLSLIVFVFHWF
jgi:hypothetical protein